MGVVTVALAIAGATQATAQNPAPALAAARDARAKTETAQQKNSEALDPAVQTARATQTPAAAQTAAAQTPAAAPGAPQGAQPPATAGDKTPPAPAAGYSYDPSGRRDPFISLSARGSQLPVPGGARPGGVPGLLVAEVTVKGVLKSPKGGFIALVQAPDNRTYTVRTGDKVFDGSVRAITQDAVVFSQDVNDPLSLVKQREVRKSIRPEAR